MTLLGTSKIVYEMKNIDAAKLYCKSDKCKSFFKKNWAEPERKEKEKKKTDKHKTHVCI
jgi:hypothetical protein